jgi:hypothetical protein
MVLTQGKLFLMKVYVDRTRLSSPFIYYIRLGDLVYVYDDLMLYSNLTESIVFNMYNIQSALFLDDSIRV